MQNPSAKKRIKVDPSFLKIGQAAQALGVSIDTLRRWEKTGKISTVRTPGGTRLYHISALKEINPSIQTYADEIYQSGSSSTEELLRKASDSVSSPVTPVSTSVILERSDRISLKDSFSPSGFQNDKEENQNDWTGLFKKTLFTKFLIGSALLSAVTLFLTVSIIASYLIQPKATQDFFKNKTASLLLFPFYELAEVTVAAVSPVKAKEWGFETEGLQASLIPPDNPPPMADNKTNNSSVLAAVASSQFLEINSDTQINGSLFVRDNVNNLSLEATPSANTFVLTSGNTTLTVTNDALLDQDVSTAASPTLNAINLSATKDQLVLGSTGTLTWTPTGTKTITMPDATGTVILDSATQTLTNKTI